MVQIGSKCTNNAEVVMLSLIEPRNFSQENIEERWVSSMKEEHNQIEKSGT